MAISIAGDTSQVLDGGAGNVDVTLPGSPVENDVIVVFVVSDQAFASSPFVTSGYNSIHNTTSQSPGYQSRYKVMGASPDTVVTITAPSTSKAVVLVRNYRGVDVGTIPDNGASTFDTGTSGDPDPPSYTTASSNALVVAFGGLDDDDAASGLTAPSGYSNLLAADTGQASTTDGATAMIADKVVAVAGAEDPGAFGTPGDDAWRAVTWALRQGSGTVTSTGATTVPAATGAGTSTKSMDTTGATTAPAATGSGSATKAMDTTGATAITAVTGSGTAEREVESSGATAIAAVTGSGEATVSEGSEEVTSTGATTAPAATGSGTAEREVVSTGATTAPAATGSGTAERSITTTGETTTPVAVGDGLVTVGNVILTSGDTTTPTVVGAGSAEVEELEEEPDFDPNGIPNYGGSPGGRGYYWRKKRRGPSIGALRALAQEDQGPALERDGPAPVAAPDLKPPPAPIPQPVVAFKAPEIRLPDLPVQRLLPPFKPETDDPEAEWDNDLMMFVAEWDDG